MKRGARSVRLVVELLPSLKQEDGKKITINNIILRNGEDGGNIDG